MVKLLNQQLANAVDLQLQSTHAQWNIRGPQFLALHLFCDQIANAVAETVGEIAGRTAQLGCMSSTVLRSIMGTSRLPEYPSSLRSDDLHIAALGRALASFVASARDAARTAFDIQDFATADVLARVGQTTDKLLGLVESYLERRRPEAAVAEYGTAGAFLQEGEAA
jgi:starvation-inducible DNA-binding protein